MGGPAVAPPKCLLPPGRAHLLIGVFVMSKSYKPVTLYHPQSGKTWRAESKVQEVNLLNRGWTVQEKQKPAPSNKANPSPTNKSK